MLAYAINPRSTYWLCKIDRAWGSCQQPPSLIWISWNVTKCKYTFTLLAVSSNLSYFNRHSAPQEICSRIWVTSHGFSGVPFKRPCEFPSVQMSFKANEDESILALNRWFLLLGTHRYSVDRCFWCGIKWKCNQRYMWEMSMKKFTHFMYM